MRRLSFFSFFPIAVLSVFLSMGIISSCSLLGSKSETEITFDSLRIDSIVPLFAGNQEPAITFNISLQKPVGGTAEQRDAITELINSLASYGTYFGQVVPDLDLMINAFIEDRTSNYFDECGSLTPEDVVSNPWCNYAEMLEGTYLGNYSGFLSYQMKRYMYAGGAHGQTIFTYGVLDMTTLQRVNLANLVDDATEEAITELLHQKLAELFDADSFETLLRDEVIFPDAEVTLTENFWFSPEGITWLYNAYDIACYAIGDISVTLSWDELQPLLPVESVAMRVYANS